MNETLSLTPIRKPFLQVDADFTPGPWTVYDNGSFYDIKIPWEGRTVVEDHSPSLCQVFYEGCDGIQGNPNARLIASAPELLHALQEIAQAAVDVKTVGDNEQFRAWVFARVQEAIRQVDAKDFVRRSHSFRRAMAAFAATEEVAA